MIIQGTSAPFWGGGRMSDEKHTYWDIKQPGISFNLGSGRIALYRATLEIMGYPEFYRFLFNPEKKMLAIQRCGIDDPGAHKLRSDQRTQQKSQDNPLPVFCKSYQDPIGSFGTGA